MLFISITSKFGIFLTTEISETIIFVLVKPLSCFKPLIPFIINFTILDILCNGLKSVNDKLFDKFKFIISTIFSNGDKSTIKFPVKFKNLIFVMFLRNDIFLKFIFFIYKNFIFVKPARLFSLSSVIIPDIPSINKQTRLFNFFKKENSDIFKLKKFRYTNFVKLEIGLKSFTLIQLLKSNALKFLKSFKISISSISVPHKIRSVKPVCFSKPCKFLI